MKNELKTEIIPLSILKESDCNPRRMTEEQEKHLTESIKRFGLVDPIIVNNNPERTNVIIGGHQRYKICMKLGFKEVPAVYLNLTVEQEVELNLRLNANVGEWDYELLKNIDLDLLLDVGFDDQDLANVWDDVLETENDDFDFEKELENAKDPDIKTGDIFQLGNSRLICGDSTDPETVRRLMGDEKIDMVYCDPVYNINLDYNKGIGGKAKYGGSVKDKKTNEEYKQFLGTTIENALQVAQKDAHIFYYCDQKYIWLLQTVYQELGIKNERVCMWIKNGSNV